MTTRTHNTKVNRDRQEMDLVSLIEKYGDEERCRSFLQDLRWPDGVRCPRCESTKVSRIAKRRQFDCDSCRYQFSLTSGTVFHDTHLPLWKWFLAVYLMTESRKGMSANQLKRMLKVSYKTAWYLCHRIRSAMTEADPTLLSGTVEADETYVGGKLHHRFKDRREAARGRMVNKSIVAGVIERGGKLRVQVIPDTDRETIQAFLRANLADETEAIFTDAHRSYRGAGDHNTRHEYVDHSAEEWVRGDVHTNGIESAWSLFDRAIIGSYHKLSQKHLAAYLQEFEFRFNNRGNPYLFRDTLLRLVESDALPYKDLTAPPQ